MNTPFPPEDDNKIIRIPTLAERDKMRRQKEKEQKRLENATKERFINLPPHTLYATLAILFIHIGLYIAAKITDFPVALLAMELFAFIPSDWTGGTPFTPMTVITPLSYALLHGDWFHIGMNVIMTAALGTGIERNFGPKAFWQLLIGGTLFAVAGHFLIDPYSQTPLIGISGGTSALFAAIMILFIRTKNNHNANHSQIGNVSVSMRGATSNNANKDILKLVLVFMLISIVFALMSGGSSAWAAHIAGLLGGVFIALNIIKI